ncbi:MAG: single-stranded DNA-binding protein [Firmicutes bacterium]|nr:single-stranded DNA-binding protein [Bacillota bacterium]
MDKEKQSAINTVTLSGIVDSKPIFSHELYNEAFFEFSLKVPRLSEQSDILPVTVSERLIKDANIEVGVPLALEGQFRSYNKIEDNRSKLMLTVFVRDVLTDTSVLSSPNNVTLGGYICKPPIFRTTPFNREICDVLIAVNRAYNKSDYIPCIAWGRNARFIRDLKVGGRIQISGRIQSREYNKRISESETIVKVAYEVSIAQARLMDNIITFVPLEQSDEHKETAATEE